MGNEELVIFAGKDLFRMGFALGGGATVGVMLTLGIFAALGSAYDFAAKHLSGKSKRV